MSDLCQCHKPGALFTPIDGDLHTFTKMRCGECGGIAPAPHRDKNWGDKEALDRFLAGVFNIPKNEFHVGDLAVYEMENQSFSD